MLPSVILESSFSSQILWTNCESTLADSTSTPSAWSSSYFSATAEISVGHTRVKSSG